MKNSFLIILVQTIAFAQLTITTPEQLVEFAALVNGGNNFKGKIVQLGSHIMLNDTANWQKWASKPPANKWSPIGTDDVNSFKGVFDGSDFVVSGVYVNNSSSDYQGFFGYIGDSGMVKNIGVAASHVKGKNRVGGLAGLNGGVIKHSYFSGMVTGQKDVGGFVGVHLGPMISSSYSTGKVTGQKNVGGFAGSTAFGATGDCYSLSMVAGQEDVGGFSGSNEISRLYNIYSTGAVTGRRNVGGLIGDGYKGMAKNSYYDEKMSKQRNSYNGMGKTTEEMKHKATFEGWDFEKVWGISSEVNDGYPYLLGF
jgi:hypothetical protein